jgi:uncharacterized membrane protein YeaQ/YmgE (transglycosylase-associated protein family)
MVYIVWFVVGVLVGMIVGANSRRMAYNINSGGSLLAGGLGGIIGGVVGDGLPAAAAGHLTLASIVGAVIGAAMIAWANRERASDVEY